MTHAHPSATSAADLLATSGQALCALAGAIDDLHRAALILNQMASGISQRMRAPEDYRRIAGQFSERARTCKAVEDSLVTACRSAQAATAA